MTITYYKELIQGSHEWHAARCGVLTASEMKNVISLKPTGKLEPVGVSKKDAELGKEVAHLYELLARRITKHTEPHYISSDMERGHYDEAQAKQYYSEYFEQVDDMGFVTNDKWGFVIGCSPDGLVGDGGMVECKSRRQKYQVEVMLSQSIPDEHYVQVQTALMVTERDWCDYLSYCGGMHMIPIRINAEVEKQALIADAATAFEARLKERMADYERIVQENRAKLVMTERVALEDMMF